MVSKQVRLGGPFYFPLACFMIASIQIYGCSHLEEYLAKSSFYEANEMFNKGNYDASLGKYEQIMKKYPSVTDRVLFEMGMIFAYPSYEQRDYQKSVDCFQELVRDYPESAYRRDSILMISRINDILVKENTIRLQQAKIDALEKEIGVKSSDIFTKQKSIAQLKEEVRNAANENNALQKKINDLEARIFLVQNGHADKIIIEKKERRLTLLSKGKALKIYKIALGGNPNGPKEREGDNKTPEGTYIIDSRNKDSGYHISLHISYPNERDKKMARELGVSPGGNIMIHGIKNNFSWIGDRHTRRDWTKGCIAVTDEEIEEIDKLVPNGTVIEIWP